MMNWNIHASSYCWRCCTNCCSISFRCWYGSLFSFPSIAAVGVMDGSMGETFQQRGHRELSSTSNRLPLWNRAPTHKGRNRSACPEKPVVRCGHRYQLWRLRTGGPLTPFLIARYESKSVKLHVPLSCVCRCGTCAILAMPLTISI